MKIIVPKSLTETDIIAYNVTEDEHPAYASGTLYAKGDRVISGHSRYQAIVGDSITGISDWAEATAYTAGAKCYVEATHRIYQAGADSTGQYPPNYTEGTSPVWTAIGYVNRGVVVTDTTFWVELGPTNYHGMLDSYTDTTTSGPAVTGGYSIIMEVDSSKCNAVALFNCTGSYIDLECVSSTDETLWSTRVWLVRRESKSWRDFFFGTETSKRSDTYQTFPMFYNTRLKMTLFGPSAAKCGNFVIGSTKTIGMTKFSPTLSIVDYSKKETNDFGVTYLSPGKYKKRTTLDMYIRNQTIDTVYKTLAGLRATPAVFVCDNSETADKMLESMLVYGFYKDFSIVVPGPVMSDCSIEIEGLA